MTKKYINNSVLLIGAGKMAIEYSKVLKDTNKNFIVVGRGEESALNFREKTNLPIITGGIDNWIIENDVYPQYAIIAVSDTQLGNVARSLLRVGIKNILLEKPGGLTNKDIVSVAKETEKSKANVLIAYNRRFYASVYKAKEIIKNDGGVKSFTFEFTEWSHVIEKLNKEKEVKNLWVLHNSTHVIDLAFYLGGEPKEIKSYVSGSLEWHPTGSIFIGIGITKNNSLFSYHSNWEAPGRWGVEVLTQNYRLIFRPLEKLQIQKKDSVTIEQVNLDEELDIRYKPGLYREVESFLNKDFKKFLNVQDQVNRLKFYDQISYRT